MFAKLLKHDCFAMFKHWWILAVSSVILSIIAGVCTGIVGVSYTTHYSIQAVASVLLAFSAIAIFIFPALSAVLMFKRFKKHLFSDEGYLTFTLPVSKNSLLSSKLVTAVIFAILSIKVVEIDVILAFTISGENFFDVMEDVIEIIRSLYYNDYYTTSNIIFNFTILAAVAAVTAFIFLCITLANVLAKKRKLLTGIGVFYGFQMISTILIRTIITNGALDFIDYKSDINIVSIGFLAVTVIFGSAVYLFNLYLLDKHLNLE